MLSRIPVVAEAAIAVALLSLAAALFFFGTTDTPSDPYPLDKACYTVVGKAGNEYKSWFAPVPAADATGVFVFNNDHTWGYVFVPEAMVADRDCLRERYPGDTMVPVLEGED